MNRIRLFGFFLFLYTLTFGSMPSRATTLQSLPPPSPPAGWILIDGPRLYTKKTLFEHLDGQAELYFKYGYQKSVFAVYQHQKRSENQIELDICDMGNVLQAFGIFSRFRTEERLGGIGLDSYGDDRSLLFYKGRYFVMLYGTESNPLTMKEVALTVSSRITDFSHPPKEIGFFPIKGLRPGSIQYFPEGLLGHQFLKRGFQGTYIEEEKTKVKVEEKGNVKVKKVKAEVKVEDEATPGAGDQPKEFNLFLAILKNVADARNALGTYRDYLRNKGKLQSMVSTEFGPHTLKGEDPYKGKAFIVQKGPYLVGVVGFEREKEAGDRLGEVLGNIK